MGQTQGKTNLTRKVQEGVTKANETLTKTASGLFGRNASAPEVTDRDVKLLREMWLKLNKDIATVGVHTFIDLFEAHPGVQDVFTSFRIKDKSELEHDKVLRAHALRVMGTVDKCINRLDNREKLRDIVMELGRKHFNYSVKIKFLELMGPQFILTMKPYFEEMWTDEHEKAWDNLFKLICFHMKEGMASCST